jgi:hypothetical protein
MFSKSISATLWAIVLITSIGQAQFYEYQLDKVFPNQDEVPYNGIHGVVVDQQNKVWITPFYARLDEDLNERRNEVYIYNENGTFASFSPIHAVATGDSLLRLGPLTGINKGMDGNIYVMTHGFRTTASASDAVIGGVWNQRRSFLIVINPTNGETIEVVDITYMRTETASHAPNRPAVTADGYVAVSFVFPGSPIVILDPSNNWEVINTVTNDKTGFSRTLEISADGRKIFNPQTEPHADGAPAGHVQVLEGSIRGSYTVGNPILIGTNPGAAARYQNTDVIYFSGAGIGNTPDASEPYLSYRYYGYSISKDEIINEFDWNYGEDTIWRIPRGLAFSADGNYAYLASFTSLSGNLQRFKKGNAIDYIPNQSSKQIFSLDINVSDTNSNSKALRIGTKSDATFGYDVAYDQFAPPAPPLGAFDARITSNGEDFYTNFYPTNEQRLEWLITVKPSTNGLPLTLQWDPQALMDSIEGETCVPKNACFGELMLVDAINGGFVNVDMTKSSSVTITESFITQLKIVKTTVDFSATIRVSDTGGNSMNLGIGTTAGAKAGFDLNLDQYAPPSPPTGAFDARIRTATDDFLKNILPTTVITSEWVIVFAASTGNGPVTLSWDPLELPQEGQMLLMDVINQQFVRVNMRNQSSYTVTVEGLTQLKVVHQLTSSYERQYNAGWNLVGLPLEIQHEAYQDLFPGTLPSTLFSFANGYQTQNRLQSGKGYWLRFTNASTITFAGTPIAGKTIALNAGWNLISGLSETVALASVSDPGNILVNGTLFEFTSGYRLATELQPGLGYWVRANVSGNIELSAGAPSKSRPQTPDLSAFDRIEIVHGERQESSSFYFGKTYPSGYTVENFSVPPAPLAGIMDVRFEGGTWVNDQSNPMLLAQNLQEGSALRIHPAPDLDAVIQYQVIQHANDGRQTTSIVKGSESVILSQATQRIEIQRLGDELPVEFTLDQNYPNPFNPTTTIRFGLPESADVSLEIYTVLGQRVMTLVNENRSAGWHTVSFNGAGLSSGVYVYRIQAGGYVSTKKFMLVK